MEKKKIAVLGGGAAALTAVWKLVESDADAYDITVYQMGWRLGGKGASGRRMTSATDHRIEEHGLHFMFGFYANVFEVTRAAYRDVYPEDPNMWHRFFRDEKTAVTMINFTDPATKTWEPWPLPNPQGYGNQVGHDDDVHGTIALVVRSMFRWLRQMAELGADAHVADLDLRKSFQFTPDPDSDTALGTTRKKIDAMEEPPWIDGPVALQPYWDLGQDFVRFLDNVREPLEEDVARVGKLLDYSFDAIRGLFRSADGPKADDARARWRRLKKLASVVVTIAKGLFVDLVLQPERNWFDLDGEDFKEWIARHGGDPESPPVRALYDAVFATYKPLAAGSILQAFTRAAFLFEGGFLYKMQAGMGDTIFTPLYLALKAKGVRFEFFERVEELVPSADGNHVQSIVLERQVDLGGAGYDPLVFLDVRIGGKLKLGCWPSEPLWDRLPPAEAARVQGAGINLESGWVPVTGALHTLERGTHFDEVILGISVAGLPDVCPQLLALDPAFRAHVDALVPNTTATQGLQLWTQAPHAPNQPSPVIVPYTEPYDTIADMTHLLGAEAWVGERPQTLYYLCSAIAEPGLVTMPPRTQSAYPGDLNARGWSEAKNWCVADAPGLWTNVSPGGVFDWNALHAPAGTAGEQRFRAQFVSTTINLSDRYVIPGPGSYPLRLKSNQTRFKNLYLTGDWIRTALSIGCLEAAVMSGVQCARALALEAGNAPVPRAKGDWIDDVEAR